MYFSLAEAACGVRHEEDPILSEILSTAGALQNRQRDKKILADVNVNSDFRQLFSSYLRLTSVLSGLSATSHDPAVAINGDEGEN